MSSPSTTARPNDWNGTQKNGNDSTWFQAMKSGIGMPLVPEAVAPLSTMCMATLYPPRQKKKAWHIERMPV
ncbi:hypothetical protein D3C87_1822050 [compost metagenome]